MNDIKWIAYVKDFNLGDVTEPERLGRKAFPTRPRGEGLWLKLSFRDEDVVEGLCAFDLAAVEALIEDLGLFVTPPDLRGNTQRLFVPRAALTGVELLGAITSPRRKAEAERAKAAVETLQTDLFDL